MLPSPPGLPLPREGAEEEGEPEPFTPCPVGARSCRSVRFADAESLGQIAVVRNTFIDIPEPPGLECSPSARRSRSVPPNVRLAGHAGPDARTTAMTPVAPKGRNAYTPCFRLQADSTSPEQRLREMLDHQSRETALVRQSSISSNVSVEESVARQPSLMSMDSADSTIPSEGDRAYGTGEVARDPVRLLLTPPSRSPTVISGTGRARLREQPPGLASTLGLVGTPYPRAPPVECYASAHRCASLIEKECGFLRLRGYWLNPETDRKARRRGVVAVVRFYVHGLPWAKRARWLQPLLWSVVVVLQRHGQEATVRGGDMHVALDVGGSVRVDFAAARD